MKNINIEELLKNEKWFNVFANFYVQLKLQDKLGSSSFLFDNKRKDEVFLPIKIDEGLIEGENNQKVCDYIFIYKKKDKEAKLVFLELKRSKSEKGIKQIKATEEVIFRNYSFLKINKVLRIIFGERISSPRRNIKDFLYLKQADKLIWLLRS